MLKAEEAVKMTHKSKSEKFHTIKEDIERKIRGYALCGYLECKFRITNDSKGTEWSNNSKQLGEAVNYFRANGYFAELRKGRILNEFVIYVNWIPNYKPAPDGKLYSTWREFLRRIGIND